MKEKAKKWWLQLFVLIAAIIAMMTQSMDTLYVSPVVWYSLMGALGFCVYAIFKWG